LQFMRWTAHVSAIADLAGGGERACGGIRPGRPELDGHARLVRAGCGMTPPAKALTTVSAGRLQRGQFSRRHGIVSTILYVREVLGIHKGSIKTG
jgi:hypothetical protein